MTHSRFLSTVLIASSSIAFLSACDTTPEYGYIEGQTMGTSYHIRYQIPKDAPDKVNEEAIKTSVDNRLIEINNSMSTYQDDSLISKYNRLGAGEFLMIDHDFYRVLKDAKQVYTQSGGAFDPTVMPLINLWGFGKVQTVERLQSPPDPKEIAKAQQLIDFDSVEPYPGKKLNENKLMKIKDGVELDLSAIAKGYGVDVIAEVLREDYQIKNYMVEIGGEVATQGVNQKMQPWQIAIDAPAIDSSVSNRETITVIRQPKSTNSLHLATSGNYRNSVVFDGVRYSHTIDPIAGQPIAGGAPSVSVIANSVTLADAWATALTAMPYEKALKTAETNDVAALFIIPKDGSLGAQTEADTKISLEDSTSKDATANKPLSDDWQIVETQAMKTLRNEDNAK